MSDKSIDDLKPNPQNPRVMMKDEAYALENSMTKFGDLSSIVFNRRTGQLVGGHQRVNTLKRLGGIKDVTITETYEQPQPDGTVALGYVVYGDKKFPYREVDWAYEWETAANIAANRIQGQFDSQLLAEADAMLKQAGGDLLELTGQSQAEVERLLKSVGIGDDEPGDTEDDGKLVFKVSESDRAVIEGAIRQVHTDQQLSGKDQETINGKALVFFAQQYQASRPATPDTFEPPELPGA